MSGGQINGPGASPVSQQLPDTKALDQADQSEVIRLKNGKFKVGTSQGSVFNRTVRKVFMPKTYQREATIATQKQQAAAVDTIQNATGNKFDNVNLKDRQITVAQFRSLLNPPSPRVPDSVAVALSQPEVTPKGVFKALQDASSGLHDGQQYKHADLAGGARFANIHSPHKTVVHVRVPKTDGSRELESKPFHANYVGNDYIATQAPPNPALMLQMLYNQDTGTVVNLTNSNDKVGPYWPAEGQPQQQGDLLVQTTGIDKQDGFDVITLKIGPKGNYGNDLDSGTAKEVKIFHYHGWPDHGVPTGENVEKFNHFMDEVKARGEPNKTTVHCRAGVGRTGVFIAIDQLKQEARDGTLNRSNLLTRAAEVVWSGREDRGEQFVQRDAQFEFITTELAKELSRLEEQDSTTTDVSDLNDFDGEESNIYENTSFHASPGFEPPPTYSVNTANAIFDKLRASSYTTDAEIVADINKIDDLKEMEALYYQFSDWQKQSTTDAQQERFKALKNAAEYRLNRI